MSSVRPSATSEPKESLALTSGADAVQWLRRCNHVGEGVVLEGRPYIENKGKIVIGDRFRLASQPVQSHLMVAHQALLQIGDDVTIGFGGAITAQQHVSIGDGVSIGPFVAIADTNFHVVGRRDLRPKPRPVSIGKQVRIGSRVTILPGAVIGDGVHVVAGSVVSRVISAGQCVAGVPARPISDKITDVSGSLASHVQLVVAQTFRLNTLPDLCSGPDTIPVWDSLGALHLLLALEDAFGVSLDHSAMADARCIEDLVLVVKSTLERSGARNKRFHDQTCR